MKRFRLFAMLALAIFMVSFSACSKDDEEHFDLPQFINEAKGNYEGKLYVSFVHDNKDLAVFTPFEITSKDYLECYLPVQPIISQLENKDAAKILRSQEKILVKAEYKILHQSFKLSNLLLSPKPVSIKDGKDVVTIELSQNYGADVDTYDQWFMFNLCVSKISYNGKDCDDFKPLVFHYKGDKK